MTDRLDSKIDQLASSGLDIDELRPGQREAAHAAASGRDLLAVMPTGYGKSAIYKLAGALVDGSTLVISPLIALQRDQVDALESEDVGEAALINSHTKKSVREETTEQMIDGDIEFLFIAPEQLARAETLDMLKKAKPSLVVIDEAHCISSWGHDFRPDYLRLGDVIDDLGHPTTIALTATASPPVRREIAERLHLDDPQIFVNGFDRPNIHLSVERFASAREKDEALLARATVLGAAKGSGIIYTGTRKRAEEIATALDAAGPSSVTYHAGLSARERDDIQSRFMSGDVSVVVATTAFGMGIDKADVRFVLHADVGDSLDSYYQEMGRAGRDGNTSEAVLFYRPEDLSLPKFLGSGGSVKAEDFVAIVRVLEKGDVTIDELSEQSEISKRRVSSIVNQLHDVDAVNIDNGVISAATDERSWRDVLETLESSHEERKMIQDSRLDMMREYAESRGCRRRTLLTYFGEQFDQLCGNCDNCEAGIETTVEEGVFKSGSAVEHGEWGVGQVMRTDGDAITVLFDKAGYKTLSNELVSSGDLLRQID